VDIVGIRFPNREELLERSLVDYPLFTAVTDRPCLVIAETTAGPCKLNGPWTNPDKRNMERVLKAVGVLPPELIHSAADAIYTSGQFSGASGLVSLVCFGRSTDAALNACYPAVPQLAWGEVLEFIHARFRDYRPRKSDHEQWDEDGKAL